MISTLVNKTWFSWYPHCQQIIYYNWNKFKLHFESLCDAYGIKPKSPSVKNPTANAILVHAHQVIMPILCTYELDMANTVVHSDLETFLTDVTWAFCSTYHRVLQASPGAAIFSQDMLFDIPYLADWKKIGDYRQCQIDLNTLREKPLTSRLGLQSWWSSTATERSILLQIESRYEHDPLTITSVHTNGTIRVQCRTKSEQLNIRRVTPFIDNQT